MPVFSGLVPVTHETMGLLSNRIEGFVQTPRDVTPPQPGSVLASPFIWEQGMGASNASSTAEPSSELLSRRIGGAAMLAIRPEAMLLEECGS